MNAYVGASPTTRFSTTDSSGKFELKGLPPGLRSRHGTKLGPMTQA